MKKHVKTLILAAGLSIGLLLNGCEKTAPPKPQEKNPPESENITETAQTELPEENAARSSGAPAETKGSTDAVQGGPYGEISLSVPDGWRWETYPADSGQSIMGMYGIRFSPEEAADGYIELTYTDGFGVCGTGLKEEETTIAGQPAAIGTYDNLKYWDFIAFHEDYRGIVALTYGVEDWWETYSGQVMDILDTLSFDTSVREGGAYIHSPESELDKIGLYLTLKNISPTGATLVFSQYDADAPTGELQCGTDFALEVQKNGIWEKAPIILEDDYGFNAVAILIPLEGTSEQELDWEWLYGALAPGTYRIAKGIMDFRDTGDYDKYTVYAQFVLN